MDNQIRQAARNGDHARLMRLEQRRRGFDTQPVLSEEDIRAWYRVAYKTCECDFSLYTDGYTEPHYWIDCAAFMFGVGRAWTFGGPCWRQSYMPSCREIPPGFRQWQDCHGCKPKAEFAAKVTRLRGMLLSR